MYLMPNVGQLGELEFRFLCLVFMNVCFSLLLSFDTPSNCRIVPWGRPMSDIGLSYLKAIGIRIHTVRYQKIRKRFVKRNDQEGGDEEDDKAMNSREYKRLKAAEERRKNPPRKLVSIMHEKDKYHYITSPVRPKLLTDAPGNLVLSHYAVTFEETLILRSTDLQLGDTGKTISALSPLLCLAKISYT